MNIKTKCEKCKKEMVLLKNQKTNNYVPVLVSELITAEKFDLENTPEVEIMYQPMRHVNHARICKQ